MNVFIVLQVQYTRDNNTSSLSLAWWCLFNQWSHFQLTAQFWFYSWWVRTTNAVIDVSRGMLNTTTYTDKLSKMCIKNGVQLSSTRRDHDLELQDQDSNQKTYSTGRGVENDMIRLHQVFKSDFGVVWLWPLTPWLVAPWITCANLQKIRFIQINSFTSLVTDEWMDGRMDERTRTWCLLPV